MDVVARMEATSPRPFFATIFIGRTRRGSGAEEAAPFLLPGSASSCTGYSSGASDRAEDRAQVTLCALTDSCGAGRGVGAGFYAPDA